MARNPLQDRIKSQCDPVFINKEFAVFIPTLEVTHFVGKRIFKHSRQEKTGSLDSNDNLRDRKCVHVSFVRSITRSRHDVLLDRALITSLILN